MTDRKKRDTYQTIWCCGCSRQVRARLTNGTEIYPDQANTWELPFWKCDRCGNYVGCHHKSKNSLRPLGNIATAEVRRYRKSIHDLMDPVWRTGAMSQGQVYGKIAKALGKKEFHTGWIQSVEEAMRILEIVKGLFQK